MPEHRQFTDDEVQPAYVKNRENHLAVLKSTNPERWLGIPAGAHLMIVDYQAELMIPIRLTKVNHKNILVRCDCGRAGCTREGLLKVKWRGSHDYRDDAQTIAKVVERDAQE